MAGPGQPKTGGRVKGVTNKATAAVKEAIAAAFREVGAKDYLVQVARSDPRVFCALLSRLVPAQVRAEIEGSEPPITVVLRDYTGLSVEDGLERWRRDREEFGSVQPAIEAEVSKEGSDAAIKKLEEGSVVEMENAKPNHDDKPQPVAWVPLRSDKDKRQKVALVD